MDMFEISARPMAFSADGEIGAYILPMNFPMTVTEERREL